MTKKGLIVTGFFTISLWVWSIYVWGFGLVITREMHSYQRDDGVIGYYPNVQVAYRQNNALTNNAVVDWLIGIK